MLGQSSEDYLECLLQLEEQGKIRCVDVAKMLDVSKPSVNKAMSILKEHGYITQEIYGDIHLTPKGREEANKVFNRHKLIRSFLIDILHVSDTQAEEDACKFEHVISEETFEKLKTFYYNK
ncbi:MAG: metal-dependent transcriptional regulator [Erysipelotrichaceae bacterium]